MFGVGFVVAPNYLSQFITGATPSTTSALIDMRATYGGMALGISIFFGYCTRQPNRLRFGLLASLMVLGGIVVGCLAGIFIDGSPNYFMFVLLGAGLLFVGLITIALKQVK